MHTGLAVQLSLIALLNAEFADVIRATVITDVFLFFEFFFF